MEDLAELIRRNPSRPLQLFHASFETPLCNTVTIAHTSWQRLRGLLASPALQPDSGLLLLPSKGIHTFGMRYAIDAVLLDEQLRVLHVYNDVKPNRIRLAKRQTHSVLELPSGEARRVGIGTDDCLRFGLMCTSAPYQVSAPELPIAGMQSVRLSFGVKLLLVILLCLQGAMCWSARKTSMDGQVDLRAYYAAGALTRTGAIRNIYDDAAEHRVQQALFHNDGWRTLHFLYPPFAALPCVPLSLLSYQEAFLAVMIGNLASLFLCAWLLVREHPEWRLSAGVPFLFFLCYFPVAEALIQGQISFVLLVVVTLFYCLDRRGRPLLAGLCLAVGLVKFQVILPVALLYLLWRRYRVLAGFAVGAAALMLLSVALTGVAGLHAYAARLSSLGTSTLLDQHAARLRYAMVVTSDPNLHGLATLLLGHGTGGALLTAALSFSVLIWSVRQTPSAALAITAALLLSYHLQLYGLLLLLLPLTLLVMELRCSSREARPIAGRNRTAKWLLGGSVLLLSPPLAYVFVLRGGIVWYVLASAATLIAAGFIVAPLSMAMAPVRNELQILTSSTA